tara:strand:+ start:398 stop:1471 length:1074 start_codon:yes stop_codon:yes gene_type:complete
MQKKAEQDSIPGVENIKIKPLIKWAGGKTRLNSQLIKVTDIVLKSLNINKFDYYEPFFGGGALFFELHSNEKIDNSYINDIIPHLISFYKTVANHEWLNELFERIEELADEFNEGNKSAIYGSAKENSGWIGKFNNLWMITDSENTDNKIKDKLDTKEENIESAALFYVLNKTGFNGMFRLSQKGKFNIPKGDTDKIIFKVEPDFKKKGNHISTKENFEKASSIFANASIQCGSYEKILPPENEIDKDKSFIYLDPPYIPDSETADFTDYSKEGFKEEDHKKVANIFYHLAKDGYKVILSNNSNTVSKSMYAGNGKVFAYEVDVSRAIAKTKEGKRPPSKELLVSSFNLDELGMKRV